EIHDSYTQFPLRAVGKLFFRQNGTRHVCSGSAVASDNARLVVTAGHCVAAGDGVTWSTEVEFVPAFRNGQAPFGRWRSCGLYTTTAWFRHRDLGADVGMIKLCDRSDGARLHDVVGSLGIVFHSHRRQQWSSFGYPAAPPFDGSTLNTCEAALGREDSQSIPTLGIGCNMTGGSSGGPWIAGFRRLAGGGNYLNGVNSYGYLTLPDVMFSPYFGSTVESLWQFAISQGS
ncbi:MAG: trypsin-like serine peptidase, partial [Candidatus Competibacterales bacterium]